MSKHRSAVTVAEEEAMLAEFLSLLRDCARHLYWVDKTGLPPADMRGFVPRLEGDERPSIYPDKRRWLGEFIAPAHSERQEKTIYAKYRFGRTVDGPRLLYSNRRNIPGEDAGWDNVVRLYEEDR